MTSPLWNRYRTALVGEPLPCAFVDVDALYANIESVLRAFRGKRQKLRIATKSIRSLALLRTIQERAGETASGVMTYTASETAFLAREGERDLLLAYPTAQKSDALLLAKVNRSGATASVIVDDRAHLELLDSSARETGAVIPVVVDVDVAYSPVRGVTLGVRRSPLREVADILAFIRSIKQFPGLRFHGVMAYEAQIAGVADTSVAVRAMKRLSAHDVAKRRGEISRAIHAEGMPDGLFNGGGTGSLGTALAEGVLTEVTVGSGFLDSHLFDRYDSLTLTPAAYFALQVVRRPAPDIVTCHGGGYIASGGPGGDRLPKPALPEGLTYTLLEGAGEVQTPLYVPSGVTLSLGDPVFFRHAKAGELAEHFSEYLLVSASRVQGRAPSYRGLGLCFLG